VVGGDLKFESAPFGFAQGAAVWRAVGKPMAAEGSLMVWGLDGLRACPEFVEGFRASRPLQHSSFYSLSRSTAFIILQLEA